MAFTEIPSVVTINGISMSWDTAKKGLDKLMWQSVDSIKDYVPMLFNKDSFKELTMKRKTLSGISSAVAWDAQSPITAQGIEFLFDITATHAYYANGVTYDKPTKDFDTYSIIPKLPHELGISMAEKRQLLAAAFFVGGFTVNGPDGVPFFSASHPYDSRYTGASTFSNLVTGTIGVQTFSDAINTILGMRDPLGRPRHYKPRKLYVNETKVMLVNQILGVGIDYEYGQGNKNRNPFADFGLTVEPYPWFRGATANYWMLQADKHQCSWSDGIALTSRFRENDDYSTRQESSFASICWDNSGQGLGFVGGTGA